MLDLDEVDPASLPPKRGYTTEYLKQIAKDYEGFDAGVFLNMFIKETSPATTPLEWTEAVKGVLSKFLPKDLQDIDIQLQDILVSVEFEKATNVQYDLRNKPLYQTLAHITYRGVTRTCAVLDSETPASVHDWLNKTDLDAWISDAIYPAEGWQSGTVYPKLLQLDTFFRLGFVSTRTREFVGKLPKRLDNFTADLKAFLNTVKSETPACHEERTGDAHIGWTYYLRPSMNARRGIITSASGVIPIIKELYKHSDIEIDVITGKPPAWREGNKIFQLSTGRYSPARSLMDCDKEQNYKPIGLRPRGRELLEIITKEVSHGKHTLIVAPKAFTANGELKHLPEIANLLETPTVHIINHHHAEGVNQYDHCENTFDFLYEPRPDEIQKITTVIYRDESLSFEREKITLKKAGMELEDVYRYKDPRVQAIYDKECEKRLMQAVTRLRQMIHESKRVYLLTSEPVTGLPVLPIPCTIDDLRACQAEHGTLDMLETFLEKKAARNIKEIAEQDGVSERTAYRRSLKQRRKTKAETDAKLTKRASEMIAQGYSLRKIAAELGISRTKLKRLLNNAEVVQN